MWDLLLAPFMIRAIIAASVTGLAAPGMGTYLVQRRLSLMGDGIGHICVTGVALGLLTGTSPTYTAVVVAVVGALLIELIRTILRRYMTVRPLVYSHYGLFFCQKTAVMCISKSSCGKLPENRTESGSDIFFNFWKNDDCKGRVPKAQPIVRCFVVPGTR